MLRQSRFTVVELLCVVSVITIISSLILPAVVKARSVARIASCKNNLYSIGLYANYYASDNNNLSMPADFGNTNDGYLHHWINYLLSQTPNPDFVRCPEMSDDETFDPAGHDPTTGNIYKEASYIMNIIPESGWLKNSPEESINLNEVTKASNTIYITDAIKYLNGNHIGVNRYSRTDHGELLIPPTGDVRRVGNHHKNGFNILWGDGHISHTQNSSQLQWNITQ